MKENERNELFSAVTEQWEKRTTKHFSTKYPVGGITEYNR